MFSVNFWNLRKLCPFVLKGNVFQFRQSPVFATFVLLKVSLRFRLIPRSEPRLCHFTCGVASGRGRDRSDPQSSAGRQARGGPGAVPEAAGRRGPLCVCVKGVGHGHGHGQCLRFSRDDQHHCLSRICTARLLLGIRVRVASVPDSSLGNPRSPSAASGRKGEIQRFLAEVPGAMGNAHDVKASKPSSPVSESHGPVSSIPAAGAVLERAGSPQSQPARAGRVRGPLLWSRRGEGPPRVFLSSCGLRAHPHLLGALCPCTCRG